MADHLFCVYGCTFSMNDFTHHTVSLSHHFKHNFVGLNVNQDLITANGFTCFYMPGGDCCISN